MASERWLKAVLKSIREGVIATDRDWRVKLLNRTAEKLTGWTASEALGRPLDEIVLLSQPAPRSQGTSSEEWILTNRKGDRIAVEVTRARIEGDEGKPAGLVVAIRDVTDRKHAEEERIQHEREQQARRIAEEANRDKDEFLAMLAHELRNPLGAIRNALVAAERDESRRDQALRIAGRQSVLLARLVDDLLDASRITHGKITLRKEAISLRAIVEGVLEEARQVLHSAGHADVGVHVVDEPWVEGDPARIQQIVANLVGNAAKFTRPGGRIDVRVETEGDAAVLRVRDTGIGIPQDLLPRVFDLFQQGERGLDRAEGGLGVGLTVVKWLANLHGGRVEARSDGPGRGAEFVIRLPLAPPPAIVVTRGRSGSPAARAR